MTEDKLLPCPFCGGKAEILKGACNPVGCRNSICLGYVYRSGGQEFYGVNGYELSIKSWNTRTESTADELAEALREALNILLDEMPKIGNNYLTIEKIEQALAKWKERKP